MTTYQNIEFTCPVCGKKSNMKVLMSTNCYGYGDLDLRPPEMERSTLGSEILICPFCKYVCYNSDKVSKKVKKYVLSDSYIKNIERGNPFFIEPDGVIQAYLNLSKIFEISEEPFKAFKAAQKATWVADDYGINAIDLRIKAHQLLKNIGPDEMEEDMSACLSADLLRRTGNFTETIKLCSEYRPNNKVHEVVLAYQKQLASEQDSSCHSLAEIADEIEKASEFEETHTKEPGIYYSCRNYHVPRSDKTEFTYEDACYPEEEIDSITEPSYYLPDGNMRVSIADGVSAASRYTKSWAKNLTYAYFLKGEEFINDIPEYSDSWYYAALEEVGKAYANDPVLYRRDKREIEHLGASTTIAGAELNTKKHSINYFAIGDSCIFHIRNGKCVKQVPKLDTPDKFTNCPPQICNTYEKMKYNPVKGKDTFQDGDILLLATDGVACWIVQPEEGWTMESKIAALINCKSNDEFEQLVLKEREVQLPEMRDRNYHPTAMHDDDSTIVILEINEIQ